jgi:hypothetical protein
MQGPSRVQELVSCSPASQGFREVLLQNGSVAWVLDGRGRIADAIMVTAAVQCPDTVLLAALQPSSDGALSKLPGFSSVCLVSKGSGNQPSVYRGTVAALVRTTSVHTKGCPASLLAASLVGHACTPVGMQTIVIRVPSDPINTCFGKPKCLENKLRGSQFAA